MKDYYNTLHVLDAMIAHFDGRFEGLRQFGIGCVNLFVVILVWIVDGIAAYYAYICQRVKGLWHHCMAGKTYLVTRPAALLYPITQAFLDQYNASKEFLTASCFTVRDAALDIWITATERLARILPSKETFYLSPTAVFSMIYGLGVYVPCLLLRPGMAATMAGFDITISMLITFGVLLMKWRIILSSTDTRKLYCLNILPFLILAFAILYAFVDDSDCDPFSLPTTIQPGDCLTGGQVGKPPPVSFTVSMWLHHPYVIVIGILSVEYILGLAFHALCKATVCLFNLFALFFRPRWQPAKTYVAECWAICKKVFCSSEKAEEGQREAS